MRYPASPLTPLFSALLARAPFASGHRSLVPHTAKLLNTHCSIACTLLNSLASLFAPAFLCFQSFADSFCKTPGVGCPTSAFGLSAGVAFFQTAPCAICPSVAKQESLFSRLGAKPAHLRVLCASVAKGKGPSAPDLHNFGAPINTFRMNTCKSVSKQRTLSPSRMNTYAKPGGGGPSVVSRRSSDPSKAFSVSRCLCGKSLRPFPVLS
jgi:hypothetical protein